METSQSGSDGTSQSAPQKWLTLSLLALAALLALAVWFSATAVLPALTLDWRLNQSQQAWLTMSVQIGFVVGALVSAILNLADRLPTRWLFSASAILAGLLTAMIPILTPEIQWALLLRFTTGMLLAGVYPVGMKIVATWTTGDRGLGIGLLVGALTLGSASPHLLNAMGGVNRWEPVLLLAAASAILGGVIAAIWIREGPYRTTTPPFNWRYVQRIIRRPELSLANTGYLGHMWELYAMWAWIPVFLAASFEQQSVDPAWASLAAFVVIGIGGAGSLVAGQLADRYGRTLTTIVAMGISGTSALLIGQFFGDHPWIVVAISLVWGFTIVADSAQFSACVTELCTQEYTGTALTLQTSLGFLLTLVSIRLLPVIQSQVGWEWAFAFLAIGPALGIWGMRTLRGSPAALKLAGGRR